MPANRNKENSLIEMPLVGPKAAAALFGWSSASTWIRHLPEMPEIRRVHMLKGVFYVLEDVFRERYPTLSDQELQEKVSDYQKIIRSSNHKPREWIGPSECARISGWKSPKTWKVNLGRFPRIRKKKTARGTVFYLGDVFAALYPEASQERLDMLMVDYKLRRAEQNLKRKHRRRKTKV